MKGPSFRVVSAFGIGLMILMLIPLLLIIPLSLTASNGLVFPPQGLSLRWYKTILVDGEWLEAVWNSVNVALTTMVLSLLAFAPAGIGLGIMRRSHCLMSFFMAPLVIPPLVLAIGLYVGLGPLRNTFLALPLAHSVFVAPVVVLLIRNSTRWISKASIDAAIVHGATTMQTILSIILPRLMPAVCAAAIFSFLLSFNEPIFAMYLSTPWNQTLPVLIWGSLRFNVSPMTAAVGSLSMVISAILVFAGVRVTARSLQRGQV